MKEPVTKEPETEEAKKKLLARLKRDIEFDVMCARRAYALDDPTYDPYY